MQKDGDVLVDEDNNIGIYLEEKDNLYWHSCIYLGCDNCLHGFNIGGYHNRKNTKPATKEQRDLLFQKMREAGFEWNSKNKELKKVEYKFNINDWIVTDDSFGKIVRHVDEISNNIIDKGYVVSDENGLIYNISFDKEHKWHKWTIKDAEDGDILVYKNDDVEWILIYKNIIPESYDVPHDVLKYYALFTGNVFYDSGIVGMISENYASCFTPATKEQYDFFFQKMKEAEYEWDPEKKGIE